MATMYVDLDYQRSLPHFVQVKDNKTFNEALQSYKTFLKDKIRVRELLTTGSFINIIPEDTRGTIWKLDHDGQRQKAASLFIDALMESKDQRKWKDFLTAIELPGHELVKDIFEEGVTAAHTQMDEDRYYLGLITRHVIVIGDAIEITERLQGKGVLSQFDKEMVRARHGNEGDTSAMKLLLELLPRAKDWYISFMRVLLECGHSEFIKEKDRNIYEKITADSGIGDESSSDDDNSTKETSVTHIGDSSYMTSHETDSGPNEMNILCTDDHQKSAVNDLSDDGPVASRTRSKTRLREQQQLQDDEKPLNSYEKVNTVKPMPRVVPQKNMSQSQNTPAKVKVPNYVPPAKTNISMAEIQPNYTETAVREELFAADETLVKAPYCAVAALSNEEHSHYEPTKTKNPQPREGQTCPRELRDYKSVPLGTYTDRNMMLPNTDADTDKTVSQTKDLSLSEENIYSEEEEENEDTGEAFGFQIPQKCRCGKQFRSSEELRKHQATHNCTSQGNMSNSAKINCSLPKKHGNRESKSLEENTLRDPDETQTLSKNGSTRSSEPTLVPHFNEERSYEHTNRHLKVWKCRCGKKFLTKDALQKHETQDKCTGNLGHVAPSSENSINFHEDSLSELRPLDSPSRIVECPVSLPAKRSNRQPEDNEEKRSTCTVCGQIFKSEKGMKIHRAKSHREQHFQSLEERSVRQDISEQDFASCPPVCDQSPRQTNDEQELSTCTVCGRMFDTERGMKIHRTKSHGKQGSKSFDEEVREYCPTSNPPIYSEDQLKSDKLEKSACTVCGQIFQSERGMKIHRAKSHREQHFQSLEERSVRQDISEQGFASCPPVCDQSPRQTNVEQEKSICTVCRRTFDTEKGMKIHRTKAHGKQGSKSFDEEVREYCATSNPPVQPEEQIICDKQEKSACTVCGQIFKSERGMKIHRAQAHCEPSFQSLEESSRKQDRSIPEQGFASCPPIYNQPPRQTNDEQELSTCTVCGRTFDTEKGMKIHRTKAHGNQAFGNLNGELSAQSTSTCPVCYQIFDTEKGMKIHKTKAHGESSSAKYSDKGSNWKTTGAPNERQGQLKSLEPKQSTSTCPVCHQIFDTEKGMKIHKTKVHGESSNVKYSDQDFNRTPTQKPTQARSQARGPPQGHSRPGAQMSPEQEGHKCSTCGRSFPSEKGLNIHRTKMGHR